MNYRKLGNSGLSISEMSLGGWLTFGGSVKDKQVTRDIIVAAYDNGVNFFDIADIYARGESERFMGEVLQIFPRHTLVISSKVYWPMSDDVNDRGLSRKHIMESIDKSLARIGTDYLDLYFTHRYDDSTPLYETMRAMDDLVHQGKILYWGTSEWSADQIQDALETADKYNLYPPVVEQPNFSLLARDRMETSIMPKAREAGLGLVTFSPLASGLLTGKYDEGIPEGSRFDTVGWLKDRMYQEDLVSKVRMMRKIADDLGVTRAELSLAWVLAHPEVSSVITGATKLSQLESNLRALNLTLSPEVIDELNTLFAY